MPKLYNYVGPASLAHLARAEVPRARIDSPGDVLRWIADTEQERDRSGAVLSTFIVTPAGELWIADRQSEHVACARGGPVASAGEMMFVVGDDVTVEYVSNQSTGFCPEPESWSAVDHALRRAGLTAPPSFSNSFDFRRCNKCESINIVKDGFFVCSVCGAPLPDEWNLKSS